MDTGPLKSFATSARTELIREVGARITAVLAQGSPERVEQPKAVSALVRAIAGAGGGDKGKAHVADKVAYTWFNRIIALRFMDANGYTGIGVVSPAADQIGQPEVLAAAKRGQIDTTVVKGTSLATISGLLNGTRQPRPRLDAQAEAYALLLADYCRFWNGAMPFMFEREGDYTELLIPANLLAGDSALSRSVTVLTEEVCQDVEVIGWLYQFYISERKDEVFAGFKKNKKAGADEIPAATQLFTPHWIVRYLVENSLGRLWMLNRPSSGLASQMDYYIAPVDEEADFLKISKPEELTVIDPACGSGHMLTYAFDLLYAIYEEEGYAPSEIPSLILANNLYGTEIDPRAGALAAFALTIKARAKQRTFFTKRIKPNICVIEPITFTPDEIDLLTTREGDRSGEEAFWNQFAEADALGALIQPNAGLLPTLARHVSMLEDQEDLLTADTIEWAQQCLLQATFLGNPYDVVITNPPYMGSGNMDAPVSTWVKRHFPDEKQDLYGCFVTRCSRLATKRGLVAMVIGDTWMTIKSFENFRRDLLNGSTFETFVHMRDVSNHPDIFGANAAFVLSANPAHYRKCTFVYLDSNSEEGKRQRLVEAVRNPKVAWSYHIEPEQFDSIPGSPIAFSLSEAMLQAFSRGAPLAAFAPTREGLTTGDNARFLRRWYEVGSSSAGNWAMDSVTSNRRWFPYLKGGDFRLWWGNHEHVVDWERDGERQRHNIDHATGRVRSHNYNGDFAFRPGFTWTGLSSGGFSGRLVPDGFMFDATAPMAFPSGEPQIKALLAILNSSTGAEFLKVLAPTLHFKLGTVMSTPAPGSTPDSLLLDGIHVDKLVNLSRADWDDFETSWNFSAPSWLAGARGPSAEKLAEWMAKWSTAQAGIARDQAELEAENNRIVAEAYGLAQEVEVNVPLHRVSLYRNVEFRYGRGKTAAEYARLERADVAYELVSYAVGCMFGRYSLDEPGLILADQGATVQDYLAKVPTPTFKPDADNVIPIEDGDWFEDDVVGLFRRFLRTAFGDQHFEENLKFVTESLGVKSLRDYFITRAGRSKFYDDHVQRYKKRPIYWLFSSPRGSFNALIYMHRYTPSTVSTVLTYLREYVTKLESALQQAERAGNAKEADRLRKILVELNEYEHDTLYPKASENAVIDLDDGVKTNYPKFGAALKKIAGLEASGV